MLAVYRSVLADLPLGISPSKYHFHSVITIGVWALVGCFFSLLSHRSLLFQFTVSMAEKKPVRRTYALCSWFLLCDHGSASSALSLPRFFTSPLTAQTVITSCSSHQSMDLFSACIMAPNHSSSRTRTQVNNFQER